MDIRDIVQQLLREDTRGIGRLTKGCGSCRKFVRQLRRQPRLAIGWDDVPQELLERFSSQLRQRLCWY